MRKMLKEQLNSLMDTLMKANNAMAIIPESELKTFLSDEQAAAIEIGNSIEDSEGEDCNTVRLLEQYCEELWKISESQVSVTDGVNILNGLLENIQKDIQNFRQTYEVVFMPYKAGMWDCMDTVWRAAVEDKDCKVYVVPIPFCEKDSDDRFGDWICEDSLFPEYVTITHYTEFSLAKHCPDIIFIHNPYDNCNHVSSVHPDYYSRELKKFTPMLVYIPYFILKEHMPKLHSILPAYLYADKIILNNEKMFDDIDPVIPRHKLLALGSPKEERLHWLSAHRDELNIPESWRTKLQDKKIIFYNTSITEILNKGEKRLDKIEEFIKVMKRQEFSNFVTIWRPHPLLEGTFKSMRPDLLDRYHNLLAEFENSGIGILDHTGDPDVAVVLADLYVGDAASSIVEMFRVLEKPRFIQSEDEIYQPAYEELCSDRAFDFCFVGDDIWFVTHKNQFLCKMNTNDCIIRVVNRIPDTYSMGFCGKVRYINILHHDGKLYIAPYFANSIYIYDINNNTFTEKSFKEENDGASFGRIFLHKNRIYMTPVKYPAIVCYDIVKGEFEYFYAAVSTVNKDIPPVGNPYMWGTCVHNNMLYLGSLVCNKVITFNMDTCAYNISKVGAESYSFRGMCADDKYNWMIMPDSPSVIRWNRENNEVTEYSEFPEGFERGQIPFKNIIDNGSEILLIPLHANHIYSLDKENGKISEVDYSLPYDESGFESPYFRRADTRYEAARTNKNMLVLISAYNQSFVLIDLDKKTNRVVPIRIEENMHIRKENIITQDQLYEHDSLPLSEYLFENIPNGTDSRCDSGIINKCGEKIFKACKDDSYLKN